MKITQFTIDNNQRQLSLAFSTADGIIVKTLSFEYLRISTPLQASQKTNPSQSIISHKKDVLLSKIEGVGKHGYRLLFNDDHSAIYSEAYLEAIAFNYEARWQQYLSVLKSSGHSREAMIDFKQL